MPMSMPVPIPTLMPVAYAITLNLFSQLIYPGTKWCGPGGDALNYTDVGYYKATDLCCRNHDHCNITINSKEEKYYYKNTK